ncbi:uncharacterized protein N7483_005427 [Penicillium malachiteum]|uniref:uncharacterized protein n=1 Tax=Penicillium malachiteum TaxID=1324776 RepID=UPI0025495993|nr:uncharacterized protein N7483_005427 [Penicillium malachiteum]KAJ5730919.1 hypothetical protein N7483_005427 [Penicillium malachiteum]
MVLTAEQINNIGITGRVTSSLSMLGTITIISTFVFSRHFRSPIHRIIFFNAFFNLLDSVATMISVSGPEAGDYSSLCQFQGFALQMFPLADVLWTLAMALDTYLVVFHHHDAHSLQKLEYKFIGSITIVTFIPAIVFLFIRSPAKGPVYGNETIWCSISPNWLILRFALYYGPVWLAIGLIIICYALIGIEITRLRVEFKLTDDENIALTSNLSNNQFIPDRTQASVTTTIETNSSDAIKQADTSESHITSFSSVHQAVTSRPLTSNSTPMNYQSPKQRRVSFKQYILMPALFFLALLATWVAPTINRISTFINPDYQSYSLLLAVSTLGSLRGFWNGVIFTTIGMKGWKRRVVEKKIPNRSGRRLHC